MVFRRFADGTTHFLPNYEGLAFPPTLYCSAEPCPKLLCTTCNAIALFWAFNLYTYNLTIISTVTIQKYPSFVVPNISRCLSKLTKLSSLRYSSSLLKLLIFIQLYVTEFNTSVQVRMAGLEPTRFKAIDFKSTMSTNSITSTYSLTLNMP